MHSPHVQRLWPNSPQPGPRRNPHPHAPQHDLMEQTTVVRCRTRCSQRLKYLLQRFWPAVSCSCCAWLVRLNTASNADAQRCKGTLEARCCAAGNLASRKVSEPLIAGLQDKRVPSTHVVRTQACSRGVRGIAPGVGGAGSGVCETSSCSLCCACALVRRQKLARTLFTRTSSSGSADFAATMWLRRHQFHSWSKRLRRDPAAFPPLGAPEPAAQALPPSVPS
jgi:hypothetical protein